MQKRGFTLIELSIVLVIIGLIVGGILVGKDLIQAAQVRAMVSQYRNYVTSVNTFRSKFNALPGDLTTAQATGFGMQPTSRPGGITDMTSLQHGNGTIETCLSSGTYTPGTDIIGSEGVLFWRDLSSAGMIDGNFITATDAIATGLTTVDLPLYFPIARIKSAYWGVTSANGCSNDLDSWRTSYANSSYPWNLQDGSLTNYFFIGKIVPNVATGEMQVVGDTGGLTPVQAFQLDSKIDDGEWNNGSVRMSYNTQSGNPWMLPGPDLPYGQFGPHCADLAGYGPDQDVTQYSIQRYPNDLVCNLSIRMN